MQETDQKKGVMDSLKMELEAPLQRLVESLQTLQMWNSANEAFGKLASLSVVTLGGSPTVTSISTPKRAYSHYIKPGESLYSLSKQYKVGGGDRLPVCFQFFPFMFGGPFY